MRATLSERKASLLIRSAESRLGVVESISSACHGLERAYGQLTAPRTYAKFGMVAGGGLVGMLLLRKLTGWVGRKPATVAAVQSGRVSAGSTARFLLVQALTVLVFPWLRARLQGNGWGEVFKRVNFSHIISRWLGLEK